MNFWLLLYFNLDREGLLRRKLYRMVEKFAIELQVNGEVRFESGAVPQLKLPLKGDPSTFRNIFGNGSLQL